MLSRLPGRFKRWLKTIERVGRRWIVRSFGRLFRAKVTRVSFPDRPKILLVRLDERVGNVVLLTPLIASLRFRFPHAHLTLLGHQRVVPLIADHPDLNEFVPFDKRRILGPDGLLRTGWNIRNENYDVAIDTSNPTDPSVTQALLVRLSGAQMTIGVDQPDFGRLFTHPVTLPKDAEHEIDLRLALLAPLPGQAQQRKTTLPAPNPPNPESLLDAVRQKWGQAVMVINIGARVPEKQLSLRSYQRLVDCVSERSWTPVLTYGPKEKELALGVQKARPNAQLAPPTDLTELAWVFSQACGVITCDTGPMHISVALNTPTCGIFVSTPPGRYGYSEPPHQAIDGRSGFGEETLNQIVGWLSTVDRPIASPSSGPISTLRD